MTKIHSPFHIVEHFISPSLCEQLILELAQKEPSRTDEGKPLNYETSLKGTPYSEIVRNLIQDEVAAIEDRYDASISGMEVPIFQQFFENPADPAKPHGCENSNIYRKKWLKIKDVDLVAYLWLKDFNNGVPLDPRFEVYGAKLEFPAYNFSLVPQRGTLVIFPAGPQFITAISPVLVGEMAQLKFGIKIRNHQDGYWLYNPVNFPGSYQEWFEGQ